jgi:ABC-2 type transport system permease protein
MNLRGFADRRPNNRDARDTFPRAARQRWRVRGFGTLLYKELLRFYKVAFQTLLAPVLTALLYLLVFGHVLAEHVQAFPGVRYTAFLIPGLMMMSVLQNAFANSSSSLIQSKITGNLIFILMTPLSHVELYLGFVLAAVLRGVAVGIGVYLVALFFVSLPLHSVVALLMFAVLSSAVLATLGVIAGLWADKFDQLAGFQNFIIMPLTFLSGVFYSIHSLPPFWQGLSHFNPFFYMIDGFRYGFFGVSDVNPWRSLVIVLAALAVLAGLSLELLRRGYKIRS